MLKFDVSFDIRRSNVLHSRTFDMIDMEADTIDAEILDIMCVEQYYFNNAMQYISPSSRETTIQIPDIKWDDTIANWQLNILKFIQNIIKYHQQDVGKHCLQKQMFLNV